MAKIRLPYIVIASLLLIIICCFSAYRLIFPSLPPPTPTPPPPTWFTDWLNDPVCQPPCWQGITPGLTTITETYAILQELLWVENFEGPGRPLLDKGDIQLWWDFVPPSSGGGVAVAFDDGRISYIEIGGILSTQLENVIDKYGVPSHVFIPSCMDRKCDTRLIYMANGMAVELFLDWDRNAEGDVNVTPNAEVKGIEFFTPGEQGYLAAYPQFSESFPRWSSPWVGYAKYKFRW